MRTKELKAVRAEKSHIDKLTLEITDKMLEMSTHISYKYAYLTFKEICDTMIPLT
jgi:hypothetical protein